MAATLLSSPRAIQVSVYVVRAFVQLRALSLTHQDIAKQFAELDDKIVGINLTHDSFSRNTRIQIKKLFDALGELAKKPDSKSEPTEPLLAANSKRPIGFIIPEKYSEPKKKQLKAERAKLIGLAQASIQNLARRSKYQRWRQSRFYH
jgi:hypothetical protein